jgi:hypothetical protein
MTMLEQTIVAALSEPATTPKLSASTSLDDIHKRLSARHDKSLRAEDGTYIGPKKTKTEHTIRGRKYLFTDPVTRAEAINWLVANNV